MRFRQKGKLLNFTRKGSHLITYSDGRPPKTQVAGETDFTWYPRREWIRDVEGQHNDYNRCVHRKYSTDLLADNYSHKVIQNTYTTTSSFTGPRVGPTLDNIMDNILPKGGVDMAFLCSAMQDMTPDFQTGFSLPNFLWELGDLRTLLQWWDRAKSKYRNLSGAALNYNFGLMPFVSDIQALIDAFKGFNDAIEQAERQSGEVNIRRYTQPPEYLSDVESEIKSSYSQPEQHSTFDVRWEGTWKKNASMMYVPTFPDLKPIKNQAKLLMDRLGVNLDLYTIWQAVPYSFVVDWLIDVSSFLKAFRNKWVPVTIDVQYFGMSLKREYKVFESSQFYVESGNPSVPLFFHFIEMYDRYPVVPTEEYFAADFFPKIVADSFTFRKFILGGLLFEQRVPNKLKPLFFW